MIIYKKVSTLIKEFYLDDKNSDSPSPQGRITLNSHFTLNLV